METKKFNESVAANCRYGDVAAGIWGDWDLVWERSYADYQGSANILVHKDGQFVAYEWDYGSCEGCDTWEAACMSDEQVAEEMQRNAATMDVRTARKWAEMNHDKSVEVAFLRFCIDRKLNLPSPPFSI
jgi:hypothetical protein